MEAHVDRSDALRARARLSMEAGDLERAAADLERAVLLNPQCPQCELERGTVHLIRGSLEQALAAFERVLSLDPGSIAAQSSRALTLLRLGRLEEAFDAISMVIDARPDNDCDLHNRAVILSAMDRYREAIRDYEHALSINPKSGGSHNNLAWLLATVSDPALRDGQRALHHARAALEQGRSGAWLDTLAAAYAECGEFEAAVRIETEACRCTRPKNKAFRQTLEAYKAGLSYAAWRAKRARERAGS